MFKKIIVYLSFCSILLSQNIEINRVQSLELEGDFEFSYPKFIDQNRILLTTPNYKGLWIYDLNSKNLLQLNEHNGAGYEPVVFEEGNQVAFRIDEFVNRKKLSSIVVQNIDDLSEIYILSKQRNLGTPKLLPDGTLFFYQNETPFTVSKIFNVETDFTPSSTIKAFIENSDLVIIENGEKKKLNPLGDDINYIWPSVSPQQDKILFTAAGKGTYIFELEGKMVREIGYANYPSWSPNGKWIAYMKDKDDGHQITESDIYVLNVQSGKEFRITNSSDKIEMYPSWSKDNDKLIYGTLKGKIEIVYLKVDQ